MKITDEPLYNVNTPHDAWSHVDLAIAVAENDKDCGVTVRSHDSESLHRASAPTVRECLLQLADVWEGIAKALRERASKEKG